MCRLIIAIFATGIFAGFAIGPAHAAQPADPAPTPHETNRGDTGNGHHNRNIIGIRSPTRNRGYQHTNNSNAGGLNSTLNALCRGARTCNLRQHLVIVVKRPTKVVVTPSRTSPPAPSFQYVGPYGIATVK